MLDVEYNDQVSVRRLAGPRDGHGKPTLVTLVEKDTEGKDTDVPLYVECFITRRRSVQRSAQGATKTVDATLLYTVDDSPVVLRDEDLIIVESSGETFKVSSISELTAAFDGVKRATVFLARTKFPVAPNAVDSEGV